MGKITFGSKKVGHVFHIIDTTVEFIAGVLIDSNEECFIHFLVSLTKIGNIGNYNQGSFSFVDEGVFPHPKTGKTP